MPLYTRTNLLKLAWIADSNQVDYLVEAIAASYRGEVDRFNCLFGKVISLQTYTGLMKCIDPAVAQEDRCVSDDGIQNLVLKTEQLCPKLCVPDPQVFLDDSIPDIIIFTQDEYSDALPAVAKNDFKPGDFLNPPDFV